MSSSLLLVLIVVVWLFVLAPLVINRREPIRRTSEALGKTRVLHRGGEELTATRRRPTFSASDIRVSDEADESLETVEPVVDEESSVDDVLYDDTKPHGASDESTPEVVDGDVVWELEQASDEDAQAGHDGERESASESNGDAQAELVDATDDAESEVESAELDDAMGELSEDLSADNSEQAKVAEIHADAAHDVVSSPVTPAVPEVYVDEDDLMFGTEDSEADSEAAAEAQAEAAEEDTAESENLESAEGDSTLAAEEVATEGSLSERADAPIDDTLTADDYAFAERRRGRGGFDPVTDARYAETRFARRRRSVAGLISFILVTIIVGVIVGGWTWWLPLVGAGLLAVYLVNLRRTVRAENELRRRRIRRMKLARQGVRNVEDDELGIPQRLRRPGAVVVELDDEDPAFADLPYGEYEPHYDDDLRRVAG